MYHIVIIIHSANVEINIKIKTKHFQILKTN